MTTPKKDTSTLKFVTGNTGKFKEASAILAPIKIKLVNIDLDEIQELDPHKIIRHKLNEAFKHHKSDFFVEDTSTYYKVLKNQLPGPFMKWFLHSLGTKGLYWMAKRLGDTRAEMRTIVAYAKNPKQVYFFEGLTKGKIVKPRKMGKHGFGVDSVFVPQGSTKSLSELKDFGPTKFSPRNKAVTKLKKFLFKNAKSKFKK